jgi:UPF0271 protein
MAKLVIDSTALIELPQLPEGELYAPPKIFEEAISLGPQLRSRQINLKHPSKESKMKVEEMQKRTGDDLSPADRDAIALALDLNATLVSDDYGVQNVASFLGVRFLPLSKPGIRTRRIYKMKCENCGNWIKTQTCSICGQKGKKTVFKEELL